MNDIRWLVMAVCLCIVSISAVGADNPFGDFAEFSNWIPHGTKVERSDQHITAGKYSTKLTFNVGYDFPNVALYQNKMGGVLNLEGSKQVSFDCYNAGKDVNFVLKYEGKKPGGKYRGGTNRIKIPAGQSKVVIDVA
jgi:hypothetical protein